MASYAVAQNRIKLAQKMADSFKANPARKPIRCSTGVAGMFLLKHPEIVADGVTYITATKSLGAGVHEVYLKGFK